MKIQALREFIVKFLDLLTTSSSAIGMAGGRMRPGEIRVERQPQSKLPVTEKNEMVQNGAEVHSVPQSTLPRPFLHSLIDLAQRAFESGNTRIGEQLLNLVNESYLTH